MGLPERGDAQDGGDMNKLKGFLEKRGYKFYKNYIDLNNGCDWYACKRTTSARECMSNEKPVQIVVNPFKNTYGDATIESVTVDVTACLNGLWWKLETYSLSPKETIKHLDKIEASLVKAWEAL